MGGTKNRDAKMKANKVFSSGGGGGTKGPAVVDKRGQEVKCPYCDKTYQQSGRLKDHIATRHADQLQPQDAGGSAGASGSAAPAPAPAPTPAPAAAPAAAKSGVSAAAAAAARSAVAAAASAAAAAGKAPAVPIAGVPLSGVGPSGSGAGGGGGMMQINSRAGYYTSKSPSMHLHEWLQREKRPKARVVSKRGEDGKWTCKVVLPDPKREEDDIVVFLDAEFAADEEAEARERCAVAALHRVQGNRHLERILPKEFVPMWLQLGEAKKKRDEAFAQRAAAAKRRQDADEVRRRKANLRKPQVVVMSAAKQRLVQSLLRDRDALGIPGDPASRGSADSAADEADLSAIVDQLSAMGFSPQHVQLAYERRSAANSGGGGGAGVSVEALLDWLLVNLPSDQLPGKFTAGSTTNMVNVVARADPYLQSVARLMAFGFTSGECEAALRAAGGDEMAAHVALYCNLTGVELLARKPASAVIAGGEGDSDAWAEEMMVLESIYDTQFAVVSEDAVRLTLELPEGCAVATRTDAPLILDFVRLGGGSGADGAAVSYPDAAPLVSVSCAGLAAGALRHLTRVLAQESQQLLGEPALHSLASKALEEAAEMDEQDCAEAEAGRGRGRGGAGASAGAAGAPAADDWDAEEAADGEGGLERQDSSLVEGFEGLTVEDEEQDEGGEEEGSPAVGKGTAPRRRGPAAGAGGAAARPRRKPQIDLAAESARLSRVQRDLDAGPEHETMRRTRRSLPAFSRRQELLELLAGHEVVVVSGATGCGKSTQVPQYILEDAIAAGRGARCNIIVTQPRRISALGLASRVASERGERVGDTVGYSVRLEHRTSALTRLTFVTTGILLRRLLSDPELEDTTHIVLDEVHERSIEIDLLLLLLRDLLARRRQKAQAAANGGAQKPPPLKLVLMSATADAELFAKYMTRMTHGSRAGAVSEPASGPPAAGAPTASEDGKGQAGGRTGGSGGKDGRKGHGGDKEGGKGGASVSTMTIPGFTYPVREFYLEDIFEMTQHRIGRDSAYARRGGGGKDRDKDKEAAEQRQLSHALPSYSEHTLRSLSVVDENLINYDLLVDLVAEIIERHRRDGAAAFLSDWPQAFSSGKGDTSGGGAILVFLPGAPEISKLQRRLQESGKVLDAAGGRNNLRVLPLHGSLSSSDQSRVFARPPRGCFKVVLSTNVAETSITIDDVTVVVDAGRVKEMSHDPERGILRLQEGWVSKAAAQQRRGRAGRVRPGICFRVFSSEQWSHMPAHTEPEMLRSPLESVCLLIKGMTSHPSLAGAAGPGTASTNDAAGGPSSGGVAGFLSRCLSPPSPSAVSSAVRLLRGIGAFDGVEQMTSLGRHLNKMPMDPRVGKALVYGCMLGCLDPVLTVTAAMAHGRPVFLGGQGLSEQVTQGRKPLLKPAVTARSDHLALVVAYNRWCRELDKGGRPAGSRFCMDMGLSESSLESIQAGRAEYARVLAELGFLSSGSEAGGNAVEACRGFGAILPGSTWLAAPANRNSGNARFLKAALCAGFYPSILRVNQPTKFVEVYSGAVEAEADPKDVKFFDRDRGRTFIHPGSVCFDVGKYESGWLVYTQMTETSKLFVREVSMVPVYALLLFGGEIGVDHAAGRLWLDDWAEFKAAANVGVMVRELRSALDRLLAAKIDDPELDLGSNRVVAAVEELLSTDGF